MKNTIPAIGVLVPIANKDWVVLDEASVKYKAVMRLVNDEWVLVNPAQGKGMLVFLNDKPDPTDTHLKISAITSTGTACYANPVIS